MKNEKPYFEREEYRRYSLALEIAEQANASPDTEALRNMVQGIESEILAITGDPVVNWRWLKERTSDELERIDALIRIRQKVLNRMFSLSATAGETDRFKSINSRLHDLTMQMGKKVSKLYRSYLSQEKDGFDDDLMIHGELRADCGERSDCLRLEKDEFYGSDFLKMLVIVCDMAKGAGKYVAWCDANYKEGHRPEMDDTRLGINGVLDDGQSWTDFPCTVPDTQQTVICYATRQLCGEIGYSVPDYLRINCFWVDVNVTYQHIEDQDGTRNGWLSECTEEQFAQRFMNEAEHRPEGMSLMDYLVQRMLDLTSEDSSLLQSYAMNPEEFLKKVFRAFFR